MGGLIVLILLTLGFIIGCYYILRLILFREKIPRDVISDDIIGGALNLGTMFITIFGSIILFRYFFPDSSEIVKTICYFGSIALACLMVWLLSYILNRNTEE